MTLTLGGITFDRVVYDADGDVLYLHVGDPSVASAFDGVPEGHHVRYAKDGSLVGITLLSPKWLLEHDGEIVLTLPERTIRATDLGPVFAAA
jgi:uncharacterized protein YuzE